MHLELTDEQSAALIRELDHIVDRDRFFLSPRIKMLREIRAMIQPYPEQLRKPPPRTSTATAAPETLRECRR
jgi:hypothetical protein